MSDFNGAKPVQTVRDDEFKIKLVDGQSGSSATKILSIVGAGDAFSAGVNDLGIPQIVKDKDGNAKILTLDANNALPISDNGGAITVDASSFDIRALNSGTDSVTAIVSGSVAVTASNLDIRDLAYATDSVTAHQGGTWETKITDGTDTLAINADGSISTTTTITGTVAVSASNLDIRDLVYTSDSISAHITNGTYDLAIDSNGAIAAVVSATNLDIRDLAFATDKVDVSGSSVAISGSVAVTATNLDIRDLSHSQDSVKIGDGTDFAAISATGEVSVSLTQAQGADGATAPAQSVQVAGKDVLGNLQTMLMDSSGRLLVSFDSSASTAVCDYQTSATLGSGNTINHDYLITSGKTFTGEVVLVGARGQVKVAIGTWNGSTFTTKAVYFQDPKENRDHSIKKLTAVGDGTLKIRIAITNLDGQSSDVYSTLQGEEV